MWIPVEEKDMCTSHHYLSTPLVPVLTENMNSRKTQKSLFFAPIWNQEMMIPTGESSFLLGSKPSFQMKAPWRGGVKLCFVKRMVGLPPMLQPASLVLSILFWTSFKSKRMFVFSGLDAMKDLWKPNSLKYMLMNTNVSRIHLVFTDNLKLYIS